MQVVVYSPEKVLYDEKANEVFFPGTNGGFQIQSSHAAFVSSLKNGEIRLVKESGERVNIPISSGFVEVLDDKVSALIEE